MGCFELSHNSSNTWQINSDLPDYANKHIKIFELNQTLIEGILSANSIPFNIKGDFLLVPYLRELFSGQKKRWFPLNQDNSKFFHKSRQRVNISLKLSTIAMNGKVTERTTSVKFLCILLDEQFSW